VRRRFRHSLAACVVLPPPAAAGAHAESLQALFNGAMTALAVTVALYIHRPLAPPLDDLAAAVNRSYVRQHFGFVGAPDVEPAAHAAVAAVAAALIAALARLLFALARADSARGRRVSLALRGGLTPYDAAVIAASGGRCRRCAMAVRRLALGLIRRAHARSVVVWVGCVAVVLAGGLVAPLLARPLNAHESEECVRRFVYAVVGWLAGVDTLVLLMMGAARRCGAAVARRWRRCCRRSG